MVHWYLKDLNIEAYEKLTKALATDESWQKLPVDQRNRCMEELQQQLCEDVLDKVYEEQVVPKKAVRRRRTKKTDDIPNTAQ
jgi:hypothetical protein